MKRYLATAVCARLADDGMPVAVALLSLARTGSASVGAAVLAAWMLPHVVAAPLAGALAARVRRAGWFYAPALLGFAGAIALVTAGLGSAPTPLVMAAAALGGACGPAVTGGLSSLLSGLPTGGVRERAYALDAATYNVAGLIAPAMVTFVAAGVGAAPATLTLAASALVAATLAACLPTAAVRGQASRTAGRVGPDGTAPADATRTEQHTRAPQPPSLAHEMRTGLTTI
ncbi:MFS transporter, partial [Streptomyces sp. A7024]|nr:MFS transporter [Streptomyces coryli]